MHTSIFVNLPIADQKRSREFFAGLGYTFNEDFCEEDKALCLELGPNLYAMLLNTEFFGTFTHQPVADATASTQVLVALDAPSKEAVDEVTDRALELGATEVRADDQGLMYGRSFADLDGHIWEHMWMDLDAMQAAAPEQD